MDKHREIQRLTDMQRELREFRSSHPFNQIVVAYNVMLDKLDVLISNLITDEPSPPPKEHQYTYHVNIQICKGGHWKPSSVFVYLDSLIEYASDVRELHELLSSKINHESGDLVPLPLVVVSWTLLEGATRHPS